MEVNIFSYNNKVHTLRIIYKIVFFNSDENLFFKLKNIFKF